jgi:hypothetical protein
MLNRYSEQILPGKCGENAEDEPNKSDELQGETHGEKV